ncbi:aspartate/glutamate racemase family protein [Chromohalobacter canadensis]|uniref:Aspartate/glutamate racemase family protein n=1 Tax=Chromohalobacter canadensis TaxID=141389 RepID=A0ABZ0YGK5_9GAMM|nr:aspartate/glutamate racemase family protein [Chromohalobacter canadensis]MCK0770281.1 aspartate/glutamate racemase family protein [Chromohalobacter canadensis]MCT8468904.1 aspartate/glutamate racemase family protein [Chromohalobacter canadensis]MCT8472906.1 aspartate/glutamate racemase family protein [Chromohalobacter canadensis]MCT8500358.1 aspartate/glutamate racemase family protein [Chromohalobacter canadensis]WQH10430.1 aspartate/glutamate racemase family protein [Chromohalobacter canad
MRTIGLLGGMSWESTESYYRALNEGVKQALGGLHSAKVAMVSVDFAEIEALQREGRWDAAGEALATAARQVEHAGADFLLIATNTMHKVAPQVEAAIDIPLLHIADATAERMAADGITRVGLLGTRFTMEQDFYKQRLSARYGIDVVVPDDTQRDQVHRVIFEELCLGRIEPASREAFLAVIDALHARGAQAVILGCTEIAMLIKATDTQVPLYDTTALHAEAAVQRALSGSLLSEDTQ